MIYIGTTSNPISNFKIGTSVVQKVDWGTTRVWPAGVITHDIISASVNYSSGTQLNAGGTNYAYITGVYVTYLDGVETSRSNVTMTPTLYSGDSNIWHISGNDITAEDRLYQEGDARSASFNATYQGITYSGKQVVHQAANVKTIVSSIVNFQMNGQASPYNMDSSASTLYPTGTPTLRRAISYSSGHDGEEMTPTSYYAYNVTSTPSSFATIVYSNATYGPNAQSQNNAGGTLTRIEIPENTSGTDRQLAIGVRDTYWTNSSPTMYVINQYAKHDWVLNVYDSNNNYYIRYDSSNGVNTHEPLNITADTSTFTLIAYSTCDSTKFPLNTSRIVTRGNINLACTSVVNTPSTSALYRMTFTCDNNETASLRNGYIDIMQGQTTHTLRVIQAIDTEVFDGITIKATSGHWVLGTVVSGTSIAIIIAKDSPVTETSTAHIASIAWQWQPDPSVTPYSYSESNLSQEIAAGSTCTLNNKTYYGYWMYSPALSGYVNRPRVQINQLSGFQVV